MSKGYNIVTAATNSAEDSLINPELYAGIVRFDDLKYERNTTFYFNGNGEMQSKGCEFKLFTEGNNKRIAYKQYDLARHHNRPEESFEVQLADGITLRLCIYMY